MSLVVVVIGLGVGFLLNLAVNYISYEISNVRTSFINWLIILISGLLFGVMYLKFGPTMLFIKSIAMTAVLIVIAFVDLKFEIIPDKLWIIALAGGLAFSFTDEITLVHSLLGMLTGGGVLFILACVPNALGGGDIKMMFGIGTFLGVQRSLLAVFLAFAFSAAIISVLLLFKVKNRRDYIPFGPFLALGSLTAFLI